MDGVSEGLKERLKDFSRFKVAEWIDFEEKFAILIIEPVKDQSGLKKYEYPNVHFTERVIGYSELITLLSEISQRKYSDLNGLFNESVSEYLSKDDLTDLNKLFAPSYPLFSKYFQNEIPSFTSPFINKPIQYIFYPLDNYKRYPNNNDLLFHKDFPYFPSKSIALNDLMNISLIQPFQDTDRVYPGIIFMLPYTSTYIEKLKIIGNNLIIEYSNIKELKNYGIKIYYESSHYNFRETIQIEAINDVTLKYIPTSISLLLYEKSKGEVVDKIDSQSNYFATNPRIEFITDFRYIRDLIKEGENSQVEFKGFSSYKEITTTKENKDKFLETIISYSNTKGGLIIIGVEDNGNIRGFKDQTSIDDLRTKLVKLIDGNCEPIISFNPELIDMNTGDNLLLLYVNKGLRPPYMRKNSNGIYVRINESDRSVTRTELDDLLSNSSFEVTW